LADSIPTSATGSKATPLARAFIRELVLGQTPEGYISLCNVIVHASPPKYANIKCPTVIIAGDEDKSAPIDGCKTIQSGIGENAKLKVIESIGHWHCIEAPEEVVQIITHFLY
jgi:pimeloyl-ACP methyl ester carboxylesterase